MAETKTAKKLTGGIISIYDVPVGVSIPSFAIV